MFVELPPLEKGGPGGPVESLQTEERRFPSANVALSFPPLRRGGQGGLLKTCRLRSGDFPPRMLR